MIYDDGYKIKYVNKFLDITTVGIQRRDGNINCIFHDDSKASARCYSDNAFYCYTCNRFFYPINIIRKERLDLDQIFNDLYNKFGHVEFTEQFKKEVKKIEIGDKNIVDFTKEYFKNL